LAELAGTNEPYIEDFVPDEVCVIVHANPNADGNRLYADVRSLLNQHLPNRQRAIAGDLPGFLGEHFAEPHLAARLEESAGELLRPLARAGVQPDLEAHQATSGLRPPWVALPTAQGDRAEWHLYFQVGPNRLDFRSASMDARQLRVSSLRQLANLLNVSALGVGAPIAQPGWQVAGASPNWLTTGHDFSCAGPAALPAPESRDGRWRFEFGNSVREALSDGYTPGNGVVVAVLDTCPDPTRFNDHGNAYLRQVWNDVRVDDAAPTVLDLGYFDRPDGLDTYCADCLPWWHQGMPRDPAARERFAMPDHGLFVAGIVHDVAAEAHPTIRLIRVLNDNGIGDLLAITHVLRALPQALLGQDLPVRGGPRLIVNMSLGAVPTHVKHLERWLPSVHRALELGRMPALPDHAQSLLDAAHQNLRGTIDWLHAHDVLVVASAGNDALRQHAHGEPPPPRYPAHYQRVFAVAATDADGGAAIYSNRADLKPAANGIATFGGEAIRPATPLEPAHTETGTTRSGRENAVIGVYSGEMLPGGAENRTGWVQWAGTSFAAPIISGLAARFWMQSPDQTPDEVMARVRACASATRASGALDAPVLEAWQVHQPGRASS
jgi:Subtilase family